MKTLLSTILIGLALIPTELSANPENWLTHDENLATFSYVLCRFHVGSLDWYEVVKNDTEITIIMNQCIVEAGTPRTVVASK
jgi:hypothetical protein